MFAVNERHIRNRAKGKVIETFREEEAEKDDATPLVLGCTVGKLRMSPAPFSKCPSNMHVQM